MKKTRVTRATGFLLVLLMVVSIFGAAGPAASVEADAATTVSVTVANVIKRYQDAAKLLSLVNEQRTANGQANLVMDSTLLESAMTRAVELSVYDSLTSPNGTTVSYDFVYSTNAYSVNMFFGFQQSNFSHFLTEASYKSFGAGVVEINNRLIICIAASRERPTAVAESVLTQSNVTTNVTISALPANLGTVTTGFTSGEKTYCGGSYYAQMKHTNKNDSSMVVYFAYSCLDVTVSDLSVFNLSSSGILTAVKPGSVTVTMSLKNYPSLTASGRLIAKARDFSSCTFSAIPDQYYTGNPIRPAVTVKNASGTALTLGTDYTTTYKNNTEVGTATVTVTGINAYVGATKDINFKIVSNGSSTMALVLRTSLSSLSIGQSTTMTANVSGASGTVKYTFQYAKYTSNVSWNNLAASTTANTCKYTPTAAGMYYLKVTAVDTAGQSASQTNMITVYDKLTCSAKISSDTAPAGSIVTITPSQTGGYGPFTYALFVKKTSEDEWKVVSDYANVTAFKYTPTKMGDYDICVKCKSSSDAVAKAYLTLKVTAAPLKNTSVAPVSIIVKGSTVTLKGKATGGTGSYQFAYLYKLSTSENWTTAKDYSTSTSVNIAPAKKGTYNVCIKVKDSAGTVDKVYYDIESVLALSNTSRISSDKITRGSNVTVTCAGSGGSGSYQFAVYYKKSADSSYTTAQDFSTNNKVSVKPASSTKYDICVKVQDTSLRTTEKKYFTVTVYEPVKNTSKISTTKLSLGNKLSVTASATGGSGSYQYAVYCKKNSSSSWTTVQDYSTVKTATIKPSAAVNYDVCVKINDTVMGTVVRSYFTVTVKAAS